MKKYLFPSILGFIGLSLITYGCLTNEPPIKKNVDNECRFEGAECPNVQHYLRDYQLEYHYDTLWIYDADRLVGTNIDTSVSGLNHGKFIEETILNDNQ